MSSTQVLCDGCQQQFSTSGLASHLRQTHNPSCRAIHVSQFGYAPQKSRNSDSHSPSEDVDDSESQTFLGDFFGDGEAYGPDDFNGWSDDEQVPGSGSDSDSDKESADESDGEDLHYGWEPEPEVEPEARPPPEDDPDAAVGLPPPAARQQAENRFRIAPQYVERFNDSKGRIAGRPIETQAASGSAHTVYKEQVLGLGGATNVWAPFNSKMEWEVSRWAKMRGAGSTAFSELLAIEGVRNNHFQLCLTVWAHEIALTGSR